MIPKQETDPVVPETKQEKTPSCNAPELFAIGETVELIQGAGWTGPRDHPNSWPVWNL